MAKELARNGGLQQDAQRISAQLLHATNVVEQCTGQNEILM